MHETDDDAQIKVGGMHTADPAGGFAIYKYGEARTAAAPPGHPGVEEALKVVKSTMREFLVAGERVDVGFVFDSASDIGDIAATGQSTEGGYYGTKWGYVFGRGVITATGFRLRDRVLVLLTSSFEQTTSFDLGDAGSLLNGAALPDDLMPASAFTVSAGATPGRTAFTVDGIDAGVFLFTL